MLLIKTNGSEGKGGSFLESHSLDLPPPTPFLPYQKLMTPESTVRQPLLWFINSAFIFIVSFLLYSIGLFYCSFLIFWVRCLLIYFHFFLFKSNSFKSMNLSLCTMLVIGYFIKAIFSIGGYYSFEFPLWPTV